MPASFRHCYGARPYPRVAAVKSPILLSVATLLCVLGTSLPSGAAKKKSKQQLEAEAKQAEAEAERAEAEAKRAEAEAKRAEAEAKKARAEAAAEEDAEPEPPKAKHKKKSKKAKQAPKLEDESDDVEVEIEDASAEELAEAEAANEDEDEAENEPSDPAPEQEEDEAPSSDVLLNWLSFSIQQDALFFGAQPNVCGTTDAMGAFAPGPEEYSCHGPNGVYAGPIYAGAGNEVQGGIGLATFRLMIGYDRLLMHRLLLGGRLGYAFGGEPSVPRGDGFMPFHAELKVQYYFGEAPFSRAGFRPFAAAAVGLGEVDSSVNVDYFIDEAGYQRGEKGSFQVWRKAGAGFGALSGGAAYPLGPGQIHAELRLLVMLGNSAAGAALNVGYAYGL